MTPPATTNNDDSCDIGLQPAATLLLPYFEVDFKSPPTTAQTTLFTIQNVSAYPQIAHVVLWTDWSFPALDFNLFLTGYDVQGINLYDILARATIAPGPPFGGTSSNTTVPTNPSLGSQPKQNNENPNITTLNLCSNLPGVFSSFLLTDLQLLFTTGKATGAGIPCTAQVGGVHANAIGYVTIDVAPDCHTSLPTETGYFSHVLFDNVLTGDYQQIVPRGAKSYAEGGLLVHIRAVPEGGPAGVLTGSSLPYTFYDRYTEGLPNRTADRRQPLPTTFVPRFIQGGPNAFNTTFKIWREGITAGTCSGAKAAASNANLHIGETVRFDEHENATLWYGCCCITCPPDLHLTPATLSIPSTSGLLPGSSTSGDVAGWMYLNLNNNNVAGTYSVARPGFFPPGVTRPSQAWVITTMFAEPTYAAEWSAVALGNGCTPATAVGAQIGPAANVTP